MKLTTEFFKTLKEAEGFASAFNRKYVITEVFSLDKRGTVARFRSERDDALAWERHEALDARAVVCIYR